MARREGRRRTAASGAHELRARAVARAALAAALLLAGAAGLAYALLLPPRPLAPPLPGAALSGLTLVEPGGARRADVTLVVEGDRIARIAKGALPGASGRFAGATALPGLVDLHVHHPPAAALGQRELFALLFLAHGVTAVRDTGSFDLPVDGLRRRIEEGAIPGPRVFRCGAILDGDPPGWPGARVVRDAAAARAAVADAARSGLDCVKLYNGLAPEAVAAILAEARARGLRVVAHAPFAVPIERLANLELQHLMGLADDWSRVPEARIDAYVAHSAAAAVEHTPTLVAFARAALLERHRELLPDSEAALLPRLFRELVWSPEANPLLLRLSAGAPWSELATRVAAMQRVVGRLHAAGVAVHAGTDAMNPFVVPGASLRGEIVLLAEAGLGLEGALAAATRGAGEALGAPGLGRLEEGAPADVAIFRGDPTRDASALGRPLAVIARGRLYACDDLLAAAALQREHFDARPYAPLFGAAARRAIVALARER